IIPYLMSDISSARACVTTPEDDCVATVGYPEKVTKKPPAPPEYYHSAIVVNSDGDTIANYRKPFLYCAKTPALEGPSGFIDSQIPHLATCKWITTNHKRELTGH